MLEETIAPLEHRLGERLNRLRAAAGLSLDALARRTGVSRSMISLIERGEASPTAAVLNKLAVGLALPLASLFADPAEGDAVPVSRLAAQTVWRDPETGYVRRTLSPAAAPALELAEIGLPPGARVRYDNGPRLAGFAQQVWVLEGDVEVTAGAASHRLGPGDCLAMRIDCPTGFRNAGDRPARYLVAIAGPSRP